jgi:hypothetical protein
MGVARGQQHDLASTAVPDTPRKDSKLPSAIQLRFCHLTFVSARLFRKPRGGLPVSKGMPPGLVWWPAQSGGCVSLITFEGTAL